MNVRVATLAVIASLAAAGCAGRTAVDGAEATAIAVGTDACDFGVVAVGTVSSCTVTVGNHGGTPLQVAVVVDGDDAFDVIGRIADDVIAPGVDLDLVVQFAPAERRAYAAALHFSSNDPATPEAGVPLSGQAVSPPVCRARALSVNGVLVPADADALAVVTGDDVVVTLEDSTASTGGGAIAAWRWAVRQAPGAAALGTPEAMTTTVDVDAAGMYLVCGAVVDDEGLRSENTCCTSFVASPP